MQEIQAKITAWVNDAAQKTEEFLLGTMGRYLTEKGYADVFEINGANLIAAVEKQIAKEPAEKTINNVKYPICPECGRVLWGEEYYCATCGQKLNRGEQE
jgi:hypothetical protein